jgi:hypothetical protein
MHPPNGKAMDTERMRRTKGQKLEGPEARFTGCNIESSRAK